MKRTIICQSGKKITVEVTPAITKAAKKAIQDLAQFAAKFKMKSTVSLKAVEELAALHGTGVIRSFKSGMREAIITDAALGGSKKAFMTLVRSKPGRDMIKQLKIRKP